MGMGYITLYRKITEHELYHEEAFTKMQAWIDLLLLANYRDATVCMRGTDVTVRRGQVGWSKDRLAQRWKWSRGKVIRFLAYLVKAGQIEQQKSRVVSLITIVNYGKYQPGGTAAGTTDGTVSDTAGSTADGTERIKEIKEKKCLSVRECGKEDEVQMKKEPIISTELWECFRRGGWEEIASVVYCWVEAYGEALVAEAFQIGVSRCGRNPAVSYVQGILNNFRRRGYHGKEQQRITGDTGKQYRGKNTEKPRRKFAGHPAGGKS